MPTETKIGQKIIINSVEGWGKGHPSSTPILTPSGFIPLKDITVGSQVIGSNGKPTTVTGVFPRGVLPVYRVEMTDGSTTFCDIDHLWATTKVGDRNGEGISNGEKVRSTKEIIDSMHRNVSGSHAPKDGKYPLHRIPIVKPVNFLHDDDILPLHPYLLGCLLGDGSISVNSNVVLHKPEVDLLNKCLAFLPEGDTGVMLEKDNVIEGMRINGGVTKKELNNLDLLGCDSFSKFIPKKYLLSSIENRTKLLQGLCDTDGSVLANGSRIEFCTSSESLKTDFAFLARSLGAIVSITSRIPKYKYKGETLSGKLSYRIKVCFPESEVIPVSSTKFQNYRAIDSIELAGEDEVICIKVDAPDSLYVCEDFIVTHNTSLGAYAPDSAIIMARGETGYLSLYQNGRVPARPTMTVDDWAGLLSTLDKISESPSMKVLVFDAIGGFERLCHEMVCRRDFKNDWGDKGFASYNKGYDVALTDWLAFLNRLDRIADKGVTIIILSHIQVRNHKNPLGPDYDRYESNAHAKTTWAATVKWSDAVLFCTFRTILDKMNGKEKGIGGTERVMYTESTDAYTAKNRHGMPSEIEIPSDPAQVWPIVESLIYPNVK
jgi:hypothetical protein